MEIQAVAKVSATGMIEIYKHIQNANFRQNFTFMPKFHINNLIDDYGHNLAELTKQILDSNWGIWYPNYKNGVFIQACVIHDINDKSYHIVLERDGNDRKHIYVMCEHKERYSQSYIEIYLSCYMCDLDDNKEYRSPTIDRNFIEHIEHKVNSDWINLYL